MGMKATTIKVSRETLEMLRTCKRRLGARSYDEVIQVLLREFRRSLVERYFGVDRGRVGEFREEDRLEDREV